MTAVSPTRRLARDIVDAAAPPDRPVQTPRPSTRSARRPPIGATLAAVWLLLLLCAAGLADILPLPAPDASAGTSASPPFRAGGSLVLGTDRLGRSQLSRVVFGARSSLTVGFAATSIGLLVGGGLGLIAGYVRGAVDAVIGTLANMILTLPGMVLLLAITAVFTPSVWTLLIGLGLLAIPVFFRIARASTMTFASREFVTAARALGSSRARILVRELAPNVLLTLMAYSFLLVAVLITVEGSLSYLGVGVPPPAPSWGGMIANGQSDLRTNPHLLFVPATVMFLTVYSLNTLADRVRSSFNVREAAR